MVRPIPTSLRWIFWDLDFDALHAEDHADAIIARVLELGRLGDVRTLLDLYGEGRILRFFREVAHPLISPRTRTFWRAFFDAESETWPTPPAFRTTSAAPWID